MGAIAHAGKSACPQREVVGSIPTAPPPWLVFFSLTYSSQFLYRFVHHFAEARFLAYLAASIMGLFVYTSHTGKFALNSWRIGSGGAAVVPWIRGRSTVVRFSRNVHIFRSCLLVSCAWYRNSYFFFRHSPQSARINK